MVWFPTSASPAEHLTRRADAGLQTPRFFRPLGDADPQRRCATCRHSIGWDSVHVFCQRAAIVAVYPCGHWEREAGSD